ncbi:MAG: FecR domain-containing protein [Deltaproteobacteria bacterium]|nr:FecR domain-containing protein [Deltaproteobacteria bacterium]
MSCSKLERTLEDPAREREHILACDECRLALSQLERVNRTLRDHRVEPPAGWENRLRERLETSEKRGFASWVPAVGVAAVVALITFLVSRPSPERGRDGVATRPAPELSSSSELVRSFGPARVSATLGSSFADASALGVTKLVLDLGRLELEVSPVPAGEQFVVETAYAVARVVGTRFSVEARPLETEVRVTEGIVEVTHRASGRVDRVPAGSSVIATAARASRSPDTVTPAPRHLGAEPVEASHERSRGAADPKRSIDSSRTSDDRIEPAHSRPTVPSATNREGGQAQATFPDTSVSRLRESDRPGDLSTGQAVKDRSNDGDGGLAPPSAGPAEHSSPSKLLEVADAHRVNNEWAEAAKAYERAALGAREFADEARYRQAEALLHLDQPSAALLVLGRSNAEFPKSALAPERAALGAKAELALGHLGAAARTLLAEPPGTRELVELRLECASRIRSSDQTLAQALVEVLRAHKDATVRSRAESISAD